MVNFRNLYFILGVLVMLCVGMHTGWTSPSLPVLLNDNSEYHITSSEGSWIISMIYFGAPIGCILTAVLVDRIGRKTALIIASPFLLVAWITIAYARSAIVLMTARFIAGIANGIAFTVLPMYVGEISNKLIRGLLGSVIQISSKFGYLVINLIGISFSIRVTALVASLVPVLHFLTFFFVPESPYYLILKGRDEQAVTVLKKLNGKPNVDAEMSNLIEMRANESKQSGALIDLLTSSSNRKALGIILGLKTIEQFSGYYAIAFYCLLIFMQTGGAVEGTTATIIYACVQLTVSTASGLLVDRTGRRPLLIIATIGSACALAVEGIYIYIKDQTSIDVSNFRFVPIIALLLFNIIYNIGLTTIPLLIASEIFPTNVKAVCICISNIWFGICAILATKFFQIVKDHYGMHVPFLAFSLCSLIGAIFIFMCVPETKDKTLEQIHLDFESSSRRGNVAHNTVLHRELLLSKP